MTQAAPPIRRMHAGQIWLVNLERRRRPGEVPLGIPLIQLEPHLVLIADPRPLNWPVFPDVWWRSKLRIGALLERDEADIWEDLHKLRWQSPPYKNNYTSGLRKHRNDYIYWEHSVEWK